MYKNNRKKTRKSISTWRLNNKLLVNTSKKKSQVKLKTLEMDENKTLSPERGSGLLRSGEMELSVSEQASEHACIHSVSML